MNRKLTAIGLAAGLTGAALFGGAAFSGIASAQDDQAPTTEQQAPDQAPDQQAPPQAPDGEGCHGHRGPHLDAAAEAIGISVDDLHSALESGQTIAEAAEANGVDPQAVIDAMVTDAQDHLAEKVADGDLTQEEADAKSADLEQHITDLVNGELPPRPEGAPQRPAPEGDQS
jgi:hypothetical protein